MTQFIALCGYPKAGKSEVQDMIRRLYGHMPVDDSRPLRDAARILYGLSEWHVTTQAGKASTLEIGGETKTIRQVLGDLGLYLERDDEFHFPRLAVKTCLQKYPTGMFVFGSVRQRQPLFFKDLGRALVVEVQRPGCKPEGRFDEYDRSAIDITIRNRVDPADPAASREQLEKAVRDALDPILGLAPA